MILIRLLILGLIGWLIGRSLRKFAAPTPARRSSAAEQFEPMARCGRCGVHLPQRGLSAAGCCPGCDTAH